MKTASAIFLLVVCASAATGEEAGPVTWEEFHRNFQFGLHCTLHTQPSRVTWNPTMHYTGPGSPFVQYVREMRTYGFSGILLQLRRPEAYVPRRDSDGKWFIPADKMRQIREAVDGVLKLPPLPARVVSSRALTGGTPAVLQHGDGLEVRLDASHHASPDTIIELAIDGDAMAIEPIETLKGHTLTTDARVTASSSANPGSKRGAPETVVYYSFETGKLAKHFGEETDDDSVEIERRTRSKAKIDVERIRELIGRNHRGHFWRFWMPEAGDPQPWIEVDLGSPQTFERVAISELYGQVRGYELQRHDAGEWKTFYSGDTIDTLSVHLAEPVTAQRVRLLITKTNGELPSFVAFDLF